MTDHLLRYDPERLGDLDRRVAAAAADLAGIASDDPAAAEAMRAVRQARDRLEGQWLPLLARLSRCDAMLTWWSTGPPGSGAATDDPVAVDALFALFGGAGTAELLIDLGARDEDGDHARAVAETIRGRLVDSSRRSGLPAAFARDFVDACVAALGQPGVNPGVALSFVLGDARLDTGFVVAATRRMVEHELAAAGAEPEYGGSLWAPGSGIGAPPSILLEGDDRRRGDSPDLRAGGDPMMAALDALAADADAGRQVFGEEPVARYLMGQRDYWMDGMRRLAEAAAVAAEGSPVVASAFVNHVGSRGPTRLLAMYDNDQVADAAATVLGYHVVAVQHAILVPEALERPSGAVVEIADEVVGDLPAGTAALFDRHALDIVTMLAVGSPVGLATMRTAVDVHQRTQAAAGVGRIADGEIADPDRFLREALGDAARLEAYVAAHAGNRAEAMGRSRDDVITFWTDVASNAVDSLDVIGAGLALEPAAEALAERFAVHEAAAARDATADAAAAADKLTYVWYRELYRNGVVTPDLPGAAVDGGELVPWERFRRLDAPDRSTVRRLMEETTGTVNIDGNALRDVIKAEQLPIYVELR